MDNYEWRQRTKALIRAVLPRLTERGRTVVEFPMSGGEWSHALEDVVGLLHDDGVPVTAAEATELRILLEERTRHDPQIVDSLVVGVVSCSPGEQSSMECAVGE